MKRSVLCLILLLGSLFVQAQEHPADSLARPAAPSVETLTPNTLWDAANTAYINGDFDGAIQTYEQLLGMGLSSARLYYNLANAYFKDGELAESILYYRRALRIAPGNDDLRFNLGVAEARTKDKIEAIPEFFFVEWVRSIRHMMGCTAWSIFSLSALVCMLGMFLLYLLSQRLVLRKAGFYGTFAAALLFALTTWFAVGERRELLDDSQAIVMTVSASVKSEPDKSGVDLFVLHEGTLLTITDRHGEWCEVVIADGKKGWIESRMIEVI